MTRLGNLVIINWSVHPPFVTFVLLILLEALTFSLLLFPSPSAPDTPPQNITSYNTSSTSVVVRWDPVPLEHQLGNILGYRLFYDVTEHRNVSRRYRRALSTHPVLDRNDVFTELRGLQKFTKYCVQMSAFTRIGDGPLSNCTYVVTDEDGMYNVPCCYSAGPCPLLSSILCKYL